MKLALKKSLIIIMFGSFCCIVANEFVVKKPSEKRTKELSRSKLQESCCQQIAELLRDLPSLLKTIADMQQVGMKHVCGFIEGDKAAAVEKADKERLQEMQKKLTEMVAFVKETHGKLAAHAQELQTF